MQPNSEVTKIYYTYSHFSIQICQIFEPGSLQISWLSFEHQFFLVEWVAHPGAPGVESFRLIKADGQEVCCARGAGGEGGDLFKLALGGFLGSSAGSEIEHAW